jgi:hypothetical protein
MRRATKKFRRIHRRQIRPPSIKFSLEGGPGRINNKGRKTEKYHKGLYPPGIFTTRLPKALYLQADIGCRHGVSS